MSTALGLGGTAVTDAGLVHAKGLTRLKALGLKDTSVTDNGLVHLKGLTTRLFRSAGTCYQNLHQGFLDAPRSSPTAASIFASSPCAKDQVMAAFGQCAAKYAYHSGLGCRSE